jgi:hypothetical protein
VGAFGKVIGMPAGDFVGLGEDQQKSAIEGIDSEVRYDIVVKYSTDGFKLVDLELAGDDDGDDEGDEVLPPAKKPKQYKTNLFSGSTAQSSNRIGTCWTRWDNFSLFHLLIS